MLPFLYALFGIVFWAVYMRSTFLLYLSHAFAFHERLKSPRHRGDVCGQHVRLIITEFLAFIAAQHCSGRFRYYSYSACCGSIAPDDGGEIMIRLRS